MRIWLLFLILICVESWPNKSESHDSLDFSLDEHYSRGWDSPDTKFQLLQRPGNYVPLTLYVEILFRANDLRTIYWLTWCHVSSERHFV